MGTRADFYIGRGENATWLGSIGWDGYPDGGHPEVLASITEQNQFLHEVGVILDREDGTLPKDGWPWPWNNSQTTDYAYAFDDGRVWCSCFGSEWAELAEWVRRAQDDNDPDRERFDEWTDSLARKTAVFPDMSDIKNVTLGQRSGLIVISQRKV